MKKTFLLLFSIGTLSTVFAQGGRYQPNNDRGVIAGRDDQRTVYNNFPRRDDRNDYGFDPRRRQEEIDRVTMDYNRRMDDVQHDWHLRRREKAREIARLQHEKETAIREINARYDRFGNHNRH